MSGDVNMIRVSHSVVLKLMFSAMFMTDRLVNCRKFVEQGCLSLTLAALSSHDPGMRGAACYVLHQLSLHLETERRFPDRLQVLLGAAHLTLKLSQYPAIRTNYMLHHSTT